MRMRQIVLDTETTGLDHAQGHRVIEIGCVEIDNRRITGRHFHCFLNPDREIDEAAVEIHGLTAAFLADKQRFSQIVEEFLEFVAGAELIIHNAAFDTGFLDAELARLNPSRNAIRHICAITDSLAMARKKHPGQRNSLDALCKRYAVDNSQRDFHGALLDAEILADVYLAMTGGQTNLQLGAEEVVVQQQGKQVRQVDKGRKPLKVIRASDEEVGAHEERLQAIHKQSGQACVWLKLSGA